jgi:integrase
MDAGALSTMLEWGLKHQIIGSNPLKGLEPLPHDRPKEGRALENSEVSRLLDASPQHWHEVDHLDVHSLRRTFATNLIVNGTDTPEHLVGLPSGHRMSTVAKEAS